MNRRVLVTGAGMGCQSAAVRLHKAGNRAGVFEKECIPGGKMHCISGEGQAAELRRDVPEDDFS